MLRVLYILLHITPNYSSNVARYVYILPESYKNWYETCPKNNILVSMCNCYPKNFLENQFDISISAPCICFVYFFIFLNPKCLSLHRNWPVINVQLFEDRVVLCCKYIITRSQIFELICLNKQPVQLNKASGTHISCNLGGGLF